MTREGKYWQVRPELKQSLITGRTQDTPAFYLGNSSAMEFSPRFSQTCNTHIHPSPVTIRVRSSLPRIENENVSRNVYNRVENPSGQEPRNVGAEAHEIKKTKDPTRSDSRRRV